MTNYVCTVHITMVVAFDACMLFGAWLVVVTAVAARQWLALQMLIVARDTSDTTGKDHTDEEKDY